MLHYDCHEFLLQYSTLDQLSLCFILKVNLLSSFLVQFSYPKTIMLNLNLTSQLLRDTILLQFLGSLGQLFLGYFISTVFSLSLSNLEPELLGKYSSEIKNVKQWCRIGHQGPAEVYYICFYITIFPSFLLFVQKHATSNFSVLFFKLLKVANEFKILFLL